MASCRLLGVVSSPSIAVPKRFNCTLVPRPTRFYRVEGAVERVRPKMTTVIAIMAGLLPILCSHVTGSEVMQRIVVPMVGGMVSSAILTLVVVPAVYAVVKGNEHQPALPRQMRVI